MTIALDANIFIYALNAHTEFGEDSLTLLKSVESGIHTGVASELVYLELLSSNKLHAKDIENTEKMLVFSMVQFVPISLPVLRQAALLRRDRNIKLADAIHLATGQLSNAAYFVTNDKTLFKHSLPDIACINLAEMLTQFTTLY